MSEVRETTDDSFAADVLQSPVPVLVDFWAPWCAPCRAIAPTIEAFAAVTAGRVKVVKHNTQDHENIAMEYSIHSIPTLLLFQGGKEIKRLVGGVQTVDALKQVVLESTGVEI